MNLIGKILRGMVIGAANIIPGVSGGTMMVSMGIYDTVIHCVTHIFSEFRKSVKTLLPYAAGMLAAILALSFVMKWAFANWPLPTNTLFIGLILGGLPAILQTVRGRKLGWPGACLFILFFALLICQQVFQANNRADASLSLFNAVKLFLVGIIASATMVIPGVSGSMMLKLLGYYDIIVTEALPALQTGAAHGDWNAVLTGAGLLIPFGIGIVVGIYAIGRLIELLLQKWPGCTYMAILGLVCASPVVILMSTLSGERQISLTWQNILLSLATFALGYFAAARLGDHPAEAAPGSAETRGDSGRKES